MSFETFKKNTWQDNKIFDTDIPKCFEKYNFSNILLVNTASKCGFTRQYADLEALHNNYKQKDLLIIAQPSSNFNNQEFENDRDIQEFCKTTYNITFEILPKKNVIGSNISEYYQEIFNIVKISPKWNFHKFLIRKNENKIYSFNHFTEISEIEKILEK